MRTKVLVCVLVTFLMASAVMACGMTATNPNSGNNEKVWQVHDGNDYEIHWAEQISGVWQTAVVLTSDAADDTCPRLAFDSSGNTYVTWRRSGSVGRIFYRGRDASQGWGSEVAVSGTSTDASMPWITVYDSKPWIAWQEQGSSSTTLRAGRGDSSGPWPSFFTSSTIGTTSNTGPIALEAQSDDTADKLWTVWIDSSSQLGYSVWNATTETWGSKQTEAYSGATDIAAGKERVEDDVTQ